MSFSIAQTEYDLLTLKYQILELKAEITGSNLTPTKSPLLL